MLSKTRKVSQSLPHRHSEEHRDDLRSRREESSFFLSNGFFSRLRREKNDGTGHFRVNVYSIRLTSENNYIFRGSGMKGFKGDIPEECNIDKPRMTQRLFELLLQYRAQHDALKRMLHPRLPLRQFEDVEQDSIMMVFVVAHECRISGFLHALNMFFRREYPVIIQLLDEQDPFRIQEVEESFECFVELVSSCDMRKRISSAEDRVECATNVVGHFLESRFDSFNVQMHSLGMLFHLFEHFSGDIHSGYLDPLLRHQYRVDPRSGACIESSANLISADEKAQERLLPYTSRFERRHRIVVGRKLVAEPADISGAVLIHQSDLFH